MKLCCIMSDAPPPYPGTGGNIGAPPKYQPECHGQYQSYQQGNVVVTHPITIVQLYRECPLRVVCRFCNAEVVTSTYYENGTLTWLACFFIFLFFPLGCCLIPFCMDGLKDVVHRCPNCQQEVGRFNRM